MTSCPAVTRTAGRENIQEVKHMKKLISGLTALTLAGAMAMSVSAVAPESLIKGVELDTNLVVKTNETLDKDTEKTDETTAESTTVKPKSDTDPIPDPSSASTEVSFNINPDYTVVIPAKVTLTGKKGDKFKGAGTITAKDVFLKSTQKIVVSLTSASGFNLKTSETSSYGLPYTAKGKFGEVAKTGGKVAEFETIPGANDPQNVEVSFETDKAPDFAGDYTDPVVFTIAVVVSNEV